jgi:hypothetical protein
MSEHEEYMSVYTIEQLNELLKIKNFTPSNNSSLLQTQSTNKNVNKVKNKFKT